MKVSVKYLAVSMDLRNNGVGLDVYDNQGTRLGDLRIGKATIEWLKGRTRKVNGNQKDLIALIARLE